MVEPTVINLSLNLRLWSGAEVREIIRAPIDYNGLRNLAERLVETHPESRGSFVLSITTNVYEHAVTRNEHIQEAIDGASVDA
jgi:hypothetical protein